MLRSQSRRWRQRLRRYDRTAQREEKSWKLQKSRNGEWRGRGANFADRDVAQSIIGQKAEFHALWGLFARTSVPPPCLGHPCRANRNMSILCGTAPSSAAWLTIC